MEIAKSKLIVVVLAVVIIVVASMGYFLIKDEAQPKYISVKEGYEIAWPIAYNWSNLAKLESVDSYHDMFNGNSTCWCFYFTYTETVYNLSSNFTDHLGFLNRIIVYSNGTLDVFEYSYGTIELESFSYPIEIGNLDSDQIYSIALNNSIVNQFISTSTLEIRTYFELRYHPYYQYEILNLVNKTCWRITWSDSEHWPDSMNGVSQITMYIDANTGEILYVNTFDLPPAGHSVAKLGR